MSDSYELKLRLLNVGQGDHLFLELPDGSFGIFDFFHSETYGWLEPPALTYLKKIRSDEPEREIKIAFLCLSHPDNDHIKGMAKFLNWTEDENIKIDRIWRYAGPDPSEMKSYLERARKNTRFITGTDNIYDYLNPDLEALSNYVAKHQKVVYLQDIKRLSNELAGFIDSWCLAPLASHLRLLSGDIWIRFFEAYLEDKPVEMGNKNLFSSVVQLIFGENRLLFGGDTELKVWEDCIKHATDEHLDINWKSNFIKTSHHGSNTSTSVELWESLLSDSTTYVGISAGDSKHPSKTTISHIEQAATSSGRKVEILCTSACGDCISESVFNVLKDEWVSEAIKNKYERRCMGKDRSKYIEKTNSHRLISYVLTFSLDSRFIAVEKEIFPTAYTRKCIYLNQGKGFPNCLG